jgi:hypothetical protein
MTECWLKACCGNCRSHTCIPIKMLARTYGEGMPIGAILAACPARCSTAQQKVPPSEVWLNEEPNRPPRHGAQPGWSVQLIGKADSGDSIQDKDEARRV